MHQSVMVPDLYASPVPVSPVMVTGGLLHTTRFSQVYTMECKFILLSRRLDGTPDIYPREALKRAGPKPGGFRCVLGKESADVIFHKMTLDGAVAWAERG